MSDVTLTFPAETQNVRLARTLAAAMAARADLPVDQLEDIRLAVDEAVSQLVLDAADAAVVTCTFRQSENALDIAVSARTRSGRPPATDTFSWTVLTALVESVEAVVDDDRLTLRLHIERHISVEA